MTKLKITAPRLKGEFSDDGRYFWDSADGIRARVVRESDWRRITALLQAVGARQEFLVSTRRSDDEDNETSLAVDAAWDALVKPRGRRK